MSDGEVRLFKFINGKNNGTVSEISASSPGIFDIKAGNYVVVSLHTYKSTTDIGDDSHREWAVLARFSLNIDANGNPVLAKIDKGTALRKYNKVALKVLTTGDLSNLDYNNSNYFVNVDDTDVSDGVGVTIAKK